MRKLGSPFIRGTLSYVLLSLALTVIMAIIYAMQPERVHITLLFAAIGAGSTATGWLKYSKLQYQKGQRFIDDD